jgi:hypothetical protein
MALQFCIRDYGFAPRVAIPAVADRADARRSQLRDIARAFDVPPYKLAIEGETESLAMVQMGQQYLNGPISGYCERWKAKAEQFYELDGDDTFPDWDYRHFLKADLLSRFTAFGRLSAGRG